MKEHRFRCPFWLPKNVIEDVLQDRIRAQYDESVAVCLCADAKPLLYNIECTVNRRWNWQVLCRDNPSVLLKGKDGDHELDGASVVALKTAAAFARHRSVYWIPTEDASERGCTFDKEQCVAVQLRHRDRAKSDVTVSVCNVDALRPTHHFNELKALGTQSPFAASEAVPGHSEAPPLKQSEKICFEWSGNRAGVALKDNGRVLVFNGGTLCVNLADLGVRVTTS
jgi:hypothetical protein